MYERTYHNQVLKQGDTVTPKKPRRPSWKRVLIGVVVVALGSGIFFLIRAPRLQVAEVHVVGTNVIDTQDVSMAVKKQLVGNTLWVLPRTSIFLINEHAVEHALQKTFSRIETVSVTRDSFHSVLITIKEYDAVYLWCTEKGSDSEEGADCYFMDNQGSVYSSAPVFSGTAYPKIITGAPLETLPFQAMTREEVARIAALEKGLSDINIVPTLFHTISPREMDIDFLHNKSVAVLRIDPSVPTTTSLEYIFSGIRAEPLSSLFHNAEKVLLYIDVRFSNKVVYKFQ